MLLAGASLDRAGVTLRSSCCRGEADRPVVVIRLGHFLFLLVVLADGRLVRRQEQSTLREKALRNGRCRARRRRRTARASTRRRCRPRVPWSASDGGSRLLVATDGRSATRFQVVAAAGGRRGHRRQPPCPCRSCPQWKRGPAAVAPRRIEVPPRRRSSPRPLGLPANATFVLNAPLFMKDELQRADGGRRRRRAPAGDPRRDRGPGLPGRAGARQRPDHRGSAASARARRGSPRWSRTPRTWSWSSRPTRRSAT